MMERSNSFEGLIVWQRPHGLTLSIYRLTHSFLKPELYAMTSQMRRAAYSSRSNIAEGWAKKGVRGKARFYTIAHGFLQKLKCFVLLSSNLDYHNQKDLFNDIIDEGGKMLNTYISKLNTSTRS
jgi:four helix bundle protein